MCGFGNLEWTEGVRVQWESDGRSIREGLGEMGYQYEPDNDNYLRSWIYESGFGIDLECQKSGTLCCLGISLPRKVFVSVIR
jgi:hypothetical protein